MTNLYIKRENGNIYSFKDKEMRILHREDGPAIELPNGTKQWFLNGKRHRLDGPAIEWANGDKSWYLHGKLHRVDGPAIEYSDSLNEYWLENESYSYIPSNQYWISFCKMNKFQ